MRKIKDTPPAEDTFVAKARPTLREGSRKKLTFELTPYAHKLLREDAERRNMTQLTLLELVIRAYCDTTRKSYDPNGNF